MSPLLFALERWAERAPRLRYPLLLLTMLLLFGLAGGITGCATTAQVYTPIVDPAIGDQAHLPAALSECRALAQQVNQANATAGGAVVGALLATAIGAAFGARGQLLAQIAGGAAVVGGANTAAYAGMTQVQIIQRCLGNRGYSVLG